MSTSSITTEHYLPVEINARKEIYVVTFSANGEHLLSGGLDQNVGVWRVQDGRRVATLGAKNVLCFAVSKNGRWIAGGTRTREVFVWNSKTYEQVWKHKQEDSWDVLYGIHAVDFSPDSTRLVSGSWNHTAVIWDVKNGKKVLTLNVPVVIAAKYSQDGDRIATATLNGSVQVWDSHDGRLLADIPVKVTPWYNRGLLWFNNHIVVVSGSTIQRLDPLTGSTLAKWAVPGSDHFSCISQPKHGNFVTYSTASTIAFWDTSTHSQLDFIRCPEEICAVAFSSDDGSLAVAGEDGKITIGCLSCNMNLFPCSSPHLSLQDPNVQISDTVLDAWKHGHLEDADAFLTTAMQDTHSSNSDMVATRALVRACLKNYDTALIDANTAISIQPSIIAYVAKSLVYVSRGERHKAYRTCDIAIQYFHSSHVALLLLIKAIIVFMAGEHLDAVARIDDLIATVHCKSPCCAIQAYMHLQMGKMHMESRNYENAIRSFERARAQYSRTPLPWVVSLMSGWKFDNFCITLRQHLCEALHAAGRKKDAAESLLETANTMKEVYASTSIREWVSEFAERCLFKPKSISEAVTPDIATAIPHTTVTSLLREWANAKLTHDLWQNVLHSAVDFVVSRYTVFRVLCERLEATGHTKEACDCFRLMVAELVRHGNALEDEGEWALWKLENLGDTAMSMKWHDDAISHYSDALSLCPTIPHRFLIKRSEAYAARGLWVEALSDANTVVELDPMSPWGYERKHAALHEGGHYRDAISAFEEMLTKISRSSDPEIRALQEKYINPRQTKAAIRRAVEDTIRDSPRVLINTLSGRLFDKSEQAVSFESFPTFEKLVSSMTTHIDDVSIEHHVREHYRYGMFSHKWEENEPLFEKVTRIMVYDLEEYPTHDKLKTFCRIIRDAGLHWAWSDTCCINKADRNVLQEAIVAMFKWYQASSLTIVFLLDVLAPSRRGDLTRSIWNTRAWTFQEYHASKVVRFYTRDWKLYMNLEIPNHKESPEIILEMEEATSVSARTLMALRPGLDDVREKLCLASMRQTTLVEDAAYSLLGIFSMSLPVVYGEGDQALGRLLARLLTSSGDTNIIAWSGKSGSFNSCLPTDISVFQQLLPPHIPPSIEATEMETITATLRASSLNSASITALYDHLCALPVPLFAGQRLRLPCLVFKLGAVTAAGWNAGRLVFRAQTAALGIVKIQTNEDLSQYSPLYLVHPWIDFLLDRQPVGSVIETIPEETTDDPSSSLGEPSPTTGPTTTPIAAAKKGKGTARFASRFGLPFAGLTATRTKYAGSLLPPSTVTPDEKRTRALQVLARLKQPFGALLLAQDPSRVAAYRRVATETLITVKLEEITPAVLSKLASSVRVLDVL